MTPFPGRGTGFPMRQVYRIDLSDSYYLRGRMYLPGMPGVEGKLLDVSAHGASLVFLNGSDPKLRADEEVEVGFQVSGAEGELRAKAVVRSCARRESYVRYGFEFVDYANFGERVPLVLRAIFNRRRSPRVKPTTPVGVQVTGGRAEVESQLVDVSTTGMAVELPFHAVESFACGETVRLGLTLPEHATAIGLEATVRARRLVGPVVHLGLEFSQTGGREREAALEAIEDFVAKSETSTDCVPG